MTVARILSQKGRTVITAQPHRTLREIAATLSEHRIGAIIITGADGSVLGILSERDIVKAIALSGDGALNEAASKFMTHRVVTCRPDHRIHDVMEMMTEGKFRHMPVVVNDRLAGMISIGDAVKYRLEELENESRNLRDYIAMA